MVKELMILIIKRKRIIKIEKEIRLIAEGMGISVSLLKTLTEKYA